MLRRTFAAAACALLMAGPAAAAGSAEKAKPNKDVGQYVDLSPVGLPIVVNGQLVNYVFVYVRINLASGVNPSKWREREPYFRDALVRAGHRTPFTIPDDYQHIDTGKLTAALHREAVAITGPGVVKSVVVSSQAPRWRARAPKQQVAAKH
jgi:hypothetical protein